MHTRRLAGRPAILAVMATLALAATGCGDGSTKTTSASTADPSTSTAPAPAPEAQAGVEPCTFAGTLEPKAGPVDAYAKFLTDVRVGSHGCYDRVTFEFRPQPGDPAGPIGYKVEYQEPPITEDGSGHEVKMKGKAFLVVQMTGQGVDLTKEDAPSTYTGPTTIESADTTRIQQVRRTGDFEAVLTWVIGLDARRPFSVTTQENPARLVIDIGD